MPETVDQLRRALQSYGVYIDWPKAMRNPSDVLGKTMKERGISPSALARLIGSSQASASRWVNGLLAPSTIFAIAIERELGVPAALWNEWKLQKQRRAA